MMMKRLPLLLLLPSNSAAFSFSSAQSRRQHNVMILNAMKPPLKETAAEDVDTIRHEIEDMREEALRRMEALKSKLEVESKAIHEKQKQESMVASSVVEKLEKSGVGIETKKDTAAAATKEMSVSHKPEKLAQSRPTTTIKPKNSANLLDGTHWKIMLNIGREPGTWMPATFGASGERLLLNMEVEFSSDQLFDREEFLGGVAGAKVVKVDSLVVGPTMSEDSHPIKVKDTGGWRVVQGEGPMGTDLLRFYVELEEQACHKGSDVYCPAGRVYCTCGYFPSHEATGLKDQLQKDLRLLNNQQEQLTYDMETASMWDKLKMAKQRMDVIIETNKINARLEEARVRDPEKVMLRFSKKGDVGLTKEGGLCCKVVKGLAVEYHILGKFGIAAIEKRQEDEEDGPLLRP